MKSENLNKKRQGADKARKKARERFWSPATQEFLHDAITDVGGTIFDVERIKSQLFDRIVEFKHHTKPKAARQAMIEWATKQAALVAITRESIPQLRNAVLSIPAAFASDADRVIEAVFDHLPEYEGPVDNPAALLDWAKDFATSLVRSALNRWGRYASAQGSVLAGIWKILTNCRDLETRTGLEDVADNLELTVMEYFLKNFDEFSPDDDGLEKQLNTRGQNAARAWKTDRLAKMKSGECRKPARGLDSEAAEVVQLKRAAGINQAISKSYPIRLGPGDETPGEVVNLCPLESFDLPLDYTEPVPTTA